MTDGTRTAYAAAGVDVGAGERAVELLRDRLRRSPFDVLGGIGAFGAAFELPDGYRRPVLVGATDGVGTKTEIARRLGRFDTIGRDLVAMCADDVVCHGARPLFFLDYLAVGRVDPARVATIVGGIAGACEEIGCALVGGETAEHPGLMDPDAFDVAGFCVGVVERDEIVDGSLARAGDVVLGMASSGLHANGFSLVRQILDRHGLRLDEPLEDGRTLGDELLTPTRLYAAAVLAVSDALRRHGLRLGGLAHVTGGGLAGNLPRAVPPELAVVLRPGTWPAPQIFERLAGLGGLGGTEMRATFNCGIGMAAVVEPAAVEPAMGVLARYGIAAWPIGEVAAAPAGRPRYLEVA